MQIIRETGALLSARAAWTVGGDDLALVPTMGALHDGHLALIAEGHRQARRVAASIFVNPLQFNDPADLARYPRQETADLEKLAAAGCDLVWLPTPDTLYPEGFATTVSVGALTRRWEGEHRPGHFDGVSTVVAKLLLAVRPTVALFGEKDWQQLAVIRRMERDLGLGIRILGHETVREADGLAMSSRNALLGSEHRRDAVALPETLSLTARAIADGQDVGSSLERATSTLLAAGFSAVDYFALVDGDTLEPIGQIRENARLLAAASIGGVRLIDNMPVAFEQQSIR